MEPWIFGEAPLDQTVAAAAALRRVTGLLLAAEDDDPAVDRLIAALARPRPTSPSRPRPTGSPGSAPPSAATAGCTSTTAATSAPTTRCFPAYDIAVDGRRRPARSPSRSPTRARPGSSTAASSPCSSTASSSTTTARSGWPARRPRSASATAGRRRSSRRYLAAERRTEDGRIHSTVRRSWRGPTWSSPTCPPGDAGQRPRLRVAQGGQARHHPRPAPPPTAKGWAQTATGSASTAPARCCRAPCYRQGAPRAAASAPSSPTPTSAPPSTLAMRRAARAACTVTRAPELHRVRTSDALPEPFGARRPTVRAMEDAGWTCQRSRRPLHLGEHGPPKGTIHTHGGGLRATAAGLEARCIGAGRTALHPDAVLLDRGVLRRAAVDADRRRDPAHRGRAGAGTHAPAPGAGAGDALPGLARSGRQARRPPRFATADLSSLRDGSLRRAPAERRRRRGTANLFGMTESFGPWCGDAARRRSPAGQVRQLRAGPSPASRCGSSTRDRGCRASMG